jgi:SAM-dependent methyltransferase
MWLRGAAVFFGAFLLFQVEPILAKQIHPWFGGSAAVWTICLVFFQTGLLAGYLYAHWAATHLKPQTLALAHVALLGLSLLSLPVILPAGWKPEGGEDPSLHILGLLAVTAGLPYFLLATTSPLMQLWHWRERAVSIPYKLYAVANFASLCALLAYPFLIEPHIATRRQAWLWSGAYAAYVALAGAAALRSRRHAAPEDRSGALRTGWPERLTWLALAAVPSMLLMAVTNFLTQNIASVPFLWLVPLGLYLISFVLCFGWERAYASGVYMRLLPPILVAMAWFLWQPRLAGRHWFAIAVYSAGLFVASMFAHGELARRKPEPGRLTSFYVWVAGGGALGGLLVAVAAPLVFPGDFELPAALAATGVTALLLLGRRSWALAAVWVVVTAFLALTTVHYAHSFLAGAQVAVRDFYGSLRVMEFPSAREGERIRMLVHGGVDHGRQFLNPELRRLPTTYYGLESGIGLLLTHLEAPAAHIGVIGLGTGTLATYGRAGDRIRFYELNPKVIELAHRQFSFLADSRAAIEIVAGDGRLSLEREPPQQFDVLAVDAFAAGAIPVHLLSLEAFAVYLRHVRPGGVLALNITSGGLNLAPVVARAAEALGCHGLLIHHLGVPEEETCASTWALLAREPARLAHDALARAGAPLRTAPRVRLWTDDYSNLLAVLK